MYLIAATCSTLLVCLLNCVAGGIQANVTDVDINPSIIGGRPAREGQFRYQVVLMYQSRPNCGGSIITSRYVLTNGHCVHANRGRGRRYHFAHMSVRAGSIRSNTGGTIIRLNQIKVHPQYAPNKNDLALLRLTVPIRCSRTMCPIRVARNPPRPGTHLTVSGWGYTSTRGPASQILRYTTATALSDRECNQGASVLCLRSPRGRGICDGDSGGPAVANNFLYGVITFAIGACATERPDGTMKLSHYYSWIQQNTR